MITSPDGQRLAVVGMVVERVDRADVFVVVIVGEPVVALPRRLPDDRVARGVVEMDVAGVGLERFGGRARDRRQDLVVADRRGDLATGVEQGLEHALLGGLRAGGCGRVWIAIAASAATVAANSRS